MASEKPELTERCGGCGLVVKGGTAGCRALFEELLARDFSDATYFAVHRLLVDTYSLQHPEQYCLSPKSFAAHFTGLCWLLERGGSRAIGNDALQRWLNGVVRLEKPQLPGVRGALTIAQVLEARDAMAHAQAVERWARSTWEAYSPLHGLARQWIEQALARGSRPPSRSKVFGH